MDPLTTVSIIISMGVSAILLKYICHIDGRNCEEESVTNSVIIYEQPPDPVEEFPPKYETPPNYNELYNNE